MDNVLIVHFGQNLTHLLSELVQAFLWDFLGRGERGGGDVVSYGDGADDVFQEDAVGGVVYKVDDWCRYAWRERKRERERNREKVRERNIRH